MHLRPAVLAPEVALAALALREDVVFTQELFGCFAEGSFCFDFSAAEFPAELQIPILGNLLGFREALFLCAGPAVLAGEIAGALPAAAVGAFVDVNLSTEDGVLFRHRDVLRTHSKSENVTELTRNFWQRSLWSRRCSLECRFVPLRERITFCEAWQDLPSCPLIEQRVYEEVGPIDDIDH